MRNALAVIGHEDFKVLITNLSEDSKHVCIRLQLSEGLWTEHYAQVLVFSNRFLLLSHMPTRTVTHIPDFCDITGFMIDVQFGSFMPFKKYFVNQSKVPVKIENNGSLYG